jgi:hypothetical protein
VHEGAIPRAHSNALLGYGPISAGSETVKSTPILWKLSPFAGRQWKRIFGRFIRDGWESPAPSKR